MQIDLSAKPTLEAAYQIAVAAHEGQVRKYSGTPYISHPMEVVEILNDAGVTGQRILAAGLLHDVLEDTTYPAHLLRERVGSVVLGLVESLTNKDRGTRAQKNAAAIKRIVAASKHAQMVRLADVIHNLSDVADHDPAFAAIYLEEKKALLDALPLSYRTTDRQYEYLWERARESYTKGLEKVALHQLKRGQALNDQLMVGEEDISRMIADEELASMQAAAMF